MACRHLAGRYLRGDGVAIDLQRVGELFEQGCLLWDGYSCYAMARAVEAGTYTNPRWQPTEADRRACRVRYLDGCLHQALALMEGTPTEQDRAEAARLLRVSCNQRSGGELACFHYAQFLHSAPFAERDTISTAQHYRLACDRGIEEACRPADAMDAEVRRKRRLGLIPTNLTLDCDTAEGCGDPLDRTRLYW